MIWNDGYRAPTPTPVYVCHDGRSVVWAGTDRLEAISAVQAIADKREATNRHLVIERYVGSATDRREDEHIYGRPTA